MKKIFNQQFREHTGAELSRDVCVGASMIYPSGTKLTEEVARNLEENYKETIPTIFIRYDETADEVFKEMVCDTMLSEVRDKVDELFKTYSGGALPDSQSIKNTTNAIVEHLLVYNGPVALNLDAVMNYGRELKDHSLNTCIIATVLAIKSNKFNKETLENLAAGALLHDIGKAWLYQAYPEVSNSLRVYGPVEFGIMKTHPVIGFNMLAPDEEIPTAVKKAVLMHHIWERPEESFDPIIQAKRSYPEKYEDRELKPYNKGLFVSLIQTADSFESMTNRAWGDSLSKPSAIKLIMEHKEKEYGEGADVLSMFLSPYGVGETVVLTDMRFAVVVRQTEVPSKPVVRLATDGKILNLLQSKGIEILRAVTL
jgi:HD-GYP domain-containing protein (c-di-GMP phosphodiesterase class II)